ncbi:MAG: hypothetical protein L3J23_07985 [Flavobacteriaceae bacterium]|nr:hypothetical protein [Flavobacteriaceae bacterium]
MENKVFDFTLNLDWNLLKIVSKIDRFDASWTSIEKKEKQSLKQLKNIATVRSVGASTRIAIPFLGVKQTHHNKGGLKIYYKNDLNNEIIKGADGKYSTYENKVKELPSLYFEGTDFYYPLMIFVVTKSENYNNYFLSKEEMINEYIIKHNQEPSPGRFFNVRILNNKYNQYYKLQEYYRKK